MNDFPIDHGASLPGEQVHEEFCPNDSASNGLSRGSCRYPVAFWIFKSFAFVARVILVYLDGTMCTMVDSEILHVSGTNFPPLERFVSP